MSNISLTLTATNQNFKIKIKKLSYKGITKRLNIIEKTQNRAKKSGTSNPMKTIYSAQTSVKTT